MTERCIYCGLDSGEFDEHEACVQASMAEAVEEEDEAPDDAPTV